MSKGYFLPLLGRLAQPYGPPDAQDRPLRARRGFFFWPSSGATGNVVQLTTTWGRSLTVRQRELKTLSLPTAAAIPQAARQRPPPPLPTSAPRAELSRCQPTAARAPDPGQSSSPVSLSNVVPRLCGTREGKGLRKRQCPSSSFQSFTTIGEGDHHASALCKSSSRAQILASKASSLPWGLHNCCIVKCSLRLSSQS